MKKKLLIPLLLLLAFPALATEPAPLTSGLTISNWGIALGTSSQTIIPADGARKFLEIQNTTAATNNLACTLDGTTPAINGAGLQLAPGQIHSYESFVPTGVVKCIGSASSTAYNVNYLP